MTWLWWWALVSCTLAGVWVALCAVGNRLERHHQERERVRARLRAATYRSNMQCIPRQDRRSA